MDCRSCGVVNAPGRRYCRECGARLGQPCPVCHFFNGVEDKHCGGCGRRLKAGLGPLTMEGAASPDLGPAFADATSPADRDAPVSPGAPAEAGIAGQGVSQSEIDGLFENILDDDTGDSREGDE